MNSFKINLLTNQIRNNYYLVYKEKIIILI